jgi:hypothetical protein
MATLPTFHSSFANSSVWCAHGYGTLREEIGKTGAELRNARSLGRILTNETCCGFRQELRSKQPAGSREFDQQSVDEALPIISLMHDETLLRAASSNE